MQDTLTIHSEQLDKFFEDACIGVHWVNKSGIITQANQAELNWLGYRLEDFVNHHIGEFYVAQADIDKLLSCITQGTELRQWPAQMRRYDGTIAHVLINVNPYFKDGQFIHSICITRDVSSQKTADDTSARLAAIVDSSDDAIISKTLDGIITSWNIGAERIFGYSAAEAIGKSIEFIIPSERKHEEVAILDKLRRGERIEHFETVRLTKDGRLLDLSITVSPVKNYSGQIIGVSKVARDITERKTVEASLVEAAHRKDEFLAILAHELRNPLAPVRHSLEIMKRAEDKKDLILQARLTIDKQISHLERLVDDLLDLSRITRNQLELRPHAVELASGIQHAVETCRPFIERHNHNVTVSLPVEPVYINGDSVRLTQIFGNLLNNACKYTPPNGRISINAERADNEVIISIKDNGIGIPAEMLPRIFNMVTHKERSLDQTQMGLGIGLVLVKRLVELHGGVVTALSEGQNKGSEFIVRLPILADGKPAKQPFVVASATSSPSHHRVLVVDDQEENATTLASLLGILGYETKVAHDGVQAITVSESFQPHIIFLDIGMPNLNGYDTCREIRKHPWGKAITIVALTGWGQEEDRHKSHDAGFNYHLTKPASLTSLMEIFSSLPHNENIID